MMFNTIDDNVARLMKERQPKKESKPIQMTQEMADALRDSPGICYDGQPLPNQVYVVRYK